MLPLLRHLESPVNKIVDMYFYWLRLSVNKMPRLTSCIVFYLIYDLKTAASILSWLKKLNLLRVVVQN